MRLSVEIRQIDISVVFGPSRVCSLIQRYYPECLLILKQSMSPDSAWNQRLQGDFGSTIQKRCLGIIKIQIMQP